jgi:hypothetical protein
MASVQSATLIRKSSCRCRFTRWIHGIDRAECDTDQEVVVGLTRIAMEADEALTWHGGAGELQLFPAFRGDVGWRITGDIARLRCPQERTGWPREPRATRSWEISRADQHARLSGRLWGREAMVCGQSSRMGSRDHEGLQVLPEGLEGVVGRQGSPWEAREEGH